MGPWLRSERLTAARSHHVPRCYGAPELKDKQAEGRLEVAEAAWNGKQHYGTGGQIKRGQQDRPEHVVVKSSVRKVSRRPLECRGSGWGDTLAPGDHGHTAHNGPGAQPGADLVYQPSAKKVNKRKSKVCLERRCPELLP